MQLRGRGPQPAWGASPHLKLDGHTVLSLAPADARHTLATLAARATTLRHTSTQDQPYNPELLIAVYEPAADAAARHLLLLAVALDLSTPRRERAELYLEILANATLRTRTAAYVAARAAELQRLLADGEGPLAPHVDLSLLKMRDRDAIIDVLAGWADSVPCDVARYRDERLRGFYGARYDARANVLDWDYSMELLPLASIVHKLHFSEWRMTGLAFELRGCSYTAPNRTLCSMTRGREAGASVLRRGFWGDVANSPWPSVGVVPEPGGEPLIAKKDGRHFKTACDVAYYNLLRLLSEMEGGAPFELKPADVQDFEYGSSVAGDAGWAAGMFGKGKGKGAPQTTIVEVDEGEEDEEQAAAEEERAKVALAARYAKLPRFRLRLLSGDWGDVVRKPKHQRRYESLTVSCHAAHLLADPRLGGLLAPRAHVALETAAFIIEARKEARTAFAEKLAELAASRGWTAVDGSKAAEGMAPHLFYEYDEVTAQGLADDFRTRLGEATHEEPEAKLETEEREGADLAVASKEDEGEVKGALGEEGVARGPASDAAAPAKPADAIGLRELCAITGLPAKYRDPVSGLPYANLEAFKELRRRHPAPERELAPERTHEGAAKPSGRVDASTREIQRDIVISGAARRLNKVTLSGA